MKIEMNHVPDFLIFWTGMIYASGFYDLLKWKVLLELHYTVQAIPSEPTEPNKFLF